MEGIRRIFALELRTEPRHVQLVAERREHVDGLLTICRVLPVLETHQAIPQDDLLLDDPELGVTHSHIFRGSGHRTGDEFDEELLSVLPMASSTTEPEVAEDPIVPLGLIPSLLDHDVQVA